MPGAPFWPHPMHRRLRRRGSMSYTPRMYLGVPGTQTAPRRLAGTECRIGFRVDTAPCCFLPRNLTVVRWSVTAIELLICSHHSLRFGDSVYWFHNLNKHCASQAHLLLTDPYLLVNPLLMKPFQNSRKIHYCPINPAVNFKELKHLIKVLKPKRIISPYLDVS